MSTYYTNDACRSATAWYYATMVEPLNEQVLNFIRSDGRTIYRLAQESGVSASAISRFLSGQRSMRLETLDRLCKVLCLRLVQDPEAVK